MILRSIIVCLILALSAGCATNHADLGNKESELSEVLVQAIEYDKRGLPEIKKTLSKRPGRSGDRFTVVRLSRNRPVISYDILVTRGKPDFGKPFEIIYEWTGRGFIAGGQATEVLAGGVRFEAHSAEEAAIGLAIIATPLAVGTVGGFVIGIADGIRQTAVEMRKMVTNGEQVITCTEFDYDGMNRLSRMRMLTPDREKELVRTVFEYQDRGTKPVRTTVKSRIEGKEREIPGE